jgi:DNA-binding LacI/PurR family transcriptional regulator
LDSYLVNGLKVSRRKQKTIWDVAAKAKVSVATVSRFLNMPSMVKVETREKVQRAIRECDYVYNAIAGGLSAHRTNTLGVIVPSITNPIFANVTRGIQDRSSNYGYSIILGNTDYREEVEQKLISLFFEKRVDGIILNGPWRGKPSWSLLKGINLPFVITWQAIKDKDVNYVAFDNFNCAYRIVDYLMGLGHRRIGMIAGKFSLSERALMRWRGYQKCLSDNSIPYDARLVIQKDYSFVDGKDGMAHLLSIPSRPSAIVCGNDILAIGAIVCAKEKGLRVPADISITGFDDMEISGHYDPPLTTIAVPAYTMGQQAARILIEIIRGEVKTPQRYVLNADLIIRGSTAVKQNT